MLDTSVKYFDSTMTGAPALSGQMGKAIGVLDACLINGFGSVSLTSLVISSNVATATTSSNHNFAMLDTVGPVVTIAGASPSELNAQWRISSVPDNTTFTFATENISNQTASGSITAIRSPAGWTKLYSDTNKAVYSRTGSGASSMLLQVLDNQTTYTTFTGYESMTDVNTGTDAFGQGYQLKSSTEDATSRPWFLLADHKTVYFFPSWHAYYSTQCDGLYFGNYNSIITDDSYNCFMMNCISSTIYCPGGTSYEHAVSASGSASSMFGNGKRLVRNYLGTTKNPKFYTYGFAIGGYDTFGASNLITYPNPSSSTMLSSPIVLYELATKTIHGTLPGLFHPLHDRPLSNKSRINILPNKLGVCVVLGRNNEDSGRLIIDMTGPWS